MPRQKKDFILNPIIITLVLVIALISAFNFYQNIEKIKKIESQIEKTESKIDKAESENKDLNQHLKASDNHKYIEEIARKKLGLIKSGEKLLIPVQEKKDNKDLEKES